MTTLSFVLLLAACGETAATDAAVEAPKEDKAKGKGAKVKAPALPNGAKVRFLEPTDRAKVKNPVTVKFAVEVMAIRPAGEIVPDTGHHHLIIDGRHIPAGTVVPMDDKHLHFGKGQTETTVELPPGEHRLTMQFADGAHVSYGETMSDTVTVLVE